jgi:hypothetical protein
MAKLSYKARKKLSKKTFAIPSKKNKSNPAGKGGYPMPDKAHARNAKARASAEYKKGRMSKREFDRINAMADHMLGE